MRKLFVAGNWKMNNTADQTVALIQALRPLVDDWTGKVEVAVCPTYTSLAAASGALKGSDIGLGAQNMHWEASGAYTGEVTAQMLLTTGCTHVILGHSERRQYFAETDEGVNKKLKAALAAGLKPIVCIGETLEEREAGRIEDVVLGQLRGGLSGLSGAEMATVTLAYEPVWAIGTGKTASPAQAEEVHLMIRTELKTLFGDEVAEGVRIQYGGSMKPDNAAELLSQNNIDGGLIGGAALDAESFAAIVKAAG